MATKQELQLATLNLEYSRFVKDQVLTEVQLNELIDFFEDQHRMTRTCLIGTGIICGHHLKRYPKSVWLSEGVSVTTDGDLFRMSNTEYKYFAEYIQPDNGQYDPFYYTVGTAQKVVKLYQLLTEEDKATFTAGDVLSVEVLDSTITNWVGMLYLEYYLKNPEKCTPTNCDNMGRRQVAKPKLLLISKDDMEKVVHLDQGEVIGDDIYLKYYEAYEKYFTFPVIRPKRVILNGTNTLQSNTLAGAYYSAAKDGSSALADAIFNLYDAFWFLIDRDHNFDILNLKSKLTANLNASNALYAQYTYDYYKDVVVAYNELRDKIYSVAFECIPNLYAFPKHIMLGEPNINYGAHPPKYRHQFYPSPAVSEHKHQVNEAIGMLNRLNLMVLNFNPALADAIKITPSQDYNIPLGNRSIPFYYNNFVLLSQTWNYQKALKATDKLNLSYNTNLYDPQFVKDETLNPLDYNIDEYNFFRIEGHIGKDYKTVLRQIDDLKTQKGVPIDVVAVRLGDVKLSDINLDDFKCQFEDLNTMLQAFQVEINCVLGKGSAFFSGFTAIKEKPHINLERYIAAPDQPQWVINDAILNASKIEVANNQYNNVLMAAARTNSGASATENVKASVGAANQAVNFCDRFTTPVFGINRAVKFNIDAHPDTFGKYYTKTLETDGLSADEFVEKARLTAANDPDLVSLSDNERNVVFEYPTQIIGNLNVMQKFVPGAIREINQTFITDYRNFSANFCTRLAIMRTRLERYFRTGEYKSRGFESEYMSMINNLEKLCCGNEKLEVVMREIERRKTLILQNLSLTKYAEQHPGLEHKAGSHRGGTFVIVYASTSGTPAAQPVFNNNSARNMLANDSVLNMNNALAASQYSDIDSFALHIVNNDTAINKETELVKFYTANQIQPGSAYSEYVIKQLNTRITDISKVICKDISVPVADIVIADFCLPYLCCAECPPVAFIIEKDIPVALTLPTNQICSNADQLKFTVTPENGTIAAKDAAQAATVKVLADGSTNFDPTVVTFTADQKNVLLEFTVNGKNTTCNLNVFKHAEAAIQHALISDQPPVYTHLITPVDSSLNKLITLGFIANPQYPTESFTYDWTFGDGRTASGKQINITFDKIALANSHLTVITAQLKVTNGPCITNSETSVDYIPYAAPELELPKSKVCSDSGQILFTKYSPQGAIVSSPEVPKAVVMNSDGLPVFDTTLVPDTSLSKPITFTVGGQPTTCTIQVVKSVNLLLSGKIANFDTSKLTIVYNNSTDETLIGKQTYIWNFGKAHDQVVMEKTGDLPVDFDVQFLKKMQINAIIATVTVKDDVCNSTRTVPVDVPTINDGTECQKFVFDFITKISKLKTIEMDSRVVKTNNNQLGIFYKSAFEIIFSATDVLKSGDLNKKSNLIENIFGLLNQIFSFQFDQVPEIARILEEIIRALIMLMFNLVRCDKTIGARDLSMIQKALETFHGISQQLIKNYPQLDLKNILENDVVDFTKNFVAQLDILIKSLKTLIEDLGKFPT